MLRIQLSFRTEGGIGQVIMTCELAHDKATEVRHECAVVKKLSSAEQFIKDMLRLPCTSQGVFRVRNPDDQSPTVTAEVDAGARHDISPRRTVGTTQQQDRQAISSKWLKSTIYLVSRVLTYGVKRLNTISNIKGGEILPHEKRNLENYSILQRLYSSL